MSVLEDDWTTINKKKKGGNKVNVKFDINKIQSNVQAKNDLSTIRCHRIGSFMKKVDERNITFGEHPATLNDREVGFVVARSPGPGSPFQNMPEATLQPLEMGVGPANLHYLQEADLIVGRGTLLKFMRLFEMRPDSRYLNDMNFEVKRVSSSDNTFTALRVFDLEPWLNIPSFGHSFEDAMTHTRAKSTFFFRLALLTLPIRPGVAPLKIIITYEIDCLVKTPLSADSWLRDTEPTETEEKILVETTKVEDEAKEKANDKSEGDDSSSDEENMFFKSVRKETKITEIVLAVQSISLSNDDDDGIEDIEIELKTCDSKFAPSYIDYWYQLAVSCTKHIVIGRYEKNPDRQTATIIRMERKHIDCLLPVDHEAPKHRLSQLTSLLYWMKLNIPLSVDHATMEFKKEMRNQVVLKYIA